MNVRSKHCTARELSDLIEAAELVALSPEVARHLDSCPACQQTLTQLAGADNQWSELRDMLCPLEGDSAETGLLARHRVSAAGRREAAPLDEAHLKQFLAAPSHPEMLGRLGRYEVERVIGSGGMGVVLKGFDAELNRPVALKLLAPHLARVGAARQRFAREARAAAAVVHEHVVAIHNVDSDAEIPFLVMQYVPGESLQARVDREGPLEINEILRIGSQVAAGLAAAHEQGIVHRDIKPGNILLEQGIDRAYLTDFGLARVADDASLTQTGIVAGTPHYMSPEQARGELSDERSDLFSLGAVLYFTAVGRPPFSAERAMGVLHRVCYDRHRSLWEARGDVPDELSLLVDRLLEKRPGRRHACAGTVHERLVDILSRTQRPGRGVLRALRRFALRHRRGAMAAAVGLVSVMASFVWLATRPSPMPKALESGATAGAAAAPETNVSPALSPRDSAAFDRSFEALRERLAQLETEDEFASDRSDAPDWSGELQSVRQRLDRLQETNGLEPQPIVTGDE